MALPWDRITAWWEGLSPPDAAVAFAAAGVPLDEDLLIDPRQPRFVPWSFDPGFLDRPARDLLTDPRTEALRQERPDVGAREFPFLRLAVPPVAQFARVTATLQQAPGVSSAVVGVTRAAHAPRRLSWRWPLRIGVLGGRSEAAQIEHHIATAGMGVHPDQIRITDVDAQPCASDLLLIMAGLRDAVELARGARIRANAVLVFDTAAMSRAVRGMQALRAATGAIAAAVAADDGHGPGGPRDPALGAVFLADRLTRLLVDLAHCYPFDAALADCLRHQVLLTGELDRLATLDLAHIGRAVADELRELEPQASASPSRAPGSSGEMYPTAADSLDDIAMSGRFDGESHEAFRIKEIIESTEVELDDAARDRILQARVRQDAEATNRFVIGSNSVEVFVGPPESDSLRAPGFDFETLFDDQTRRVRLTVVLVPQEPAGKPLTHHILLPRVGASGIARFGVELPDGTTTFSGRILVIHRNRVLQTAVLTGDIGGPATLTDITLVRPDLNGLEDRRAFDLAIVANHDTRGRASLTAHRNGSTRVVNNVSGDLLDVQELAAKVRDALTAAEAATNRARWKPKPEALAPLFTELALRGHHMYVKLRDDLLAGLEDCAYVQLVTADPEWFLPLEFLYPFEPPAEDVTVRVCPDWLPGGRAECAGQCLPGDDFDVVCPGAFWGMSRTFERHRRKPGTQVDYLTNVKPTPKRRRLTLRTAAFGASEIATRFVDPVLAELGPDAARCNTWKDWGAALKSDSPRLLVLIPHHDNPYLEIGGDYKDASRLATAQYQTGGHDDLHQVVLYLGCNTAGKPGDPGGYATDALSYGAAIVFSSLSELLARNAAEYATRLLAELGSGSSRARPVGEVLKHFRRGVTTAGYPAALSIIAYGDSDWSL